MYTDTQKMAHIYELQQMLCTLSQHEPAVPCVIPDGIYGPETAAAVKAYQLFAGLRPTGEADPATWEHLAKDVLAIGEAPLPLPAFPPDGVLHPGERCYTVLVAQAVLTALAEEYADISPCPVNGVFDGETVRALQPFQKLCGLPVTGTLDCRTWNMLARAGGCLLMEETNGHRQ